jgi:SpoVK/Ycf46/Vps4 family AAA+-type ATPase
MVLIKEHNRIFLSTTGVETLEALTNKNFLLVQDASRGLALIEKEAFTYSDYILGDFKETTIRYLNTFKNSKKGMGLLFTGLKGGGKSLLSKMIAKESNLPCIVINEYFNPNELLNFLTQISQEVVVLIDEFEKIYNNEERQNEILTILDGVFTHKKLFILTSNTSEVSPYLLNRPGRIRYHKVFDGVSEEVVLSAVEDSLTNKENAEELVEITKALGNISFDSLMTIIDEMNLYGETAREVIKHLNINVEYTNYEVVLLVKSSRFSSSYFGHPLAAAEYVITYQNKEPQYGWFNREEYKVNIHQFDIEYEENGRIILIHKKNHDKLIFSRIHAQKFEI